jgi:hypothetical protein
VMRSVSLADGRSRSLRPSVRRVTTTGHQPVSSGEVHRSGYPTLCVDVNRARMQS